MAPVYPPGWQGPGKPLKPNTQVNINTNVRPTSGFNFTTAGTGGTTGTSSTNPFGPGMIQYNMGLDGFQWNNNIAGEFGIAFIGDNVTGKYLPSTSATAGMAAGSPLEINEAISKIIADNNKKPGGIEALKALLNDKQMYANPKNAANSISQGAAFDPFFTQALQTALIYATASNAQLAANQGPNPKILSFDQFLANASATGSYNSTSFGGSGGTQRTVVHQKFKPEEFEIAIDQLFQQTVGRGASEEELNDFVSKLQAYEKKNPQVTVDKKSGNTTTRTTSGGVDSATMQSMMRDEALAKPEAEGYNKSTKYLDYFMDALNSPIELG
jgi:hypothetical protein